MDEDKVNEYFETKDKVDELKMKLKYKQDEFNKENDALILEINHTKDSLDTLNSEITNDALDEYLETSKKKMYGGIGIRESFSIKYDTKLAQVWAEEHKLCLTLDKKAFEKLAKSQDIEFVKKQNKITVTFPPKISIS